MPIAESLLTLVQYDTNGGCWFWEGDLTQDEYPTIHKGEGSKSSEYVHRVFYVEEHGPIPDGLELDHLCRVTCCVNPDHLEPVTHRENLYRSPLYPGTRTHCHNGHEFTPENTRLIERVKTNGKPYMFRVCRTCARENEARYRANHKSVESVSYLS